MCFQRIAIVMASCVLLAVMASNVAADTNKSIQDINAVADQVGQVVSSPIGGFIPEPVRSLIELAVGIIGAVAAVFFRQKHTVAIAAVQKFVTDEKHPDPVLDAKANALINKVANKS